MNNAVITDQAPEALGCYSQAMHAKGDLVFLSGQIPLTPDGTLLNEAPMAQQVHQVFRNLAAVAKAAGGSLDDMVKLNVYVLDMDHFATINEVMVEYVSEPYPARALVAVAALPKGAQVEMEAVLSLSKGQ